MANIDFTDESSKHNERVSRLGWHKRRTVAMLDYLNTRSHSLSDSHLLNYRLCHNYLLFHHFPRLEKTILHDAKHCDIHLLCPMCAIRRAAKMVMKYEQKTMQLFSVNPRLRLYYVVLTVKNTASLQEGFNHLEQSMRLLVKRRREAVSFRNGKKQLNYAAKSVFAGVSAGAYSFEVKRGKNSGLWHPHANLLLLTDKPISSEAIRDEWFSITHDSFVVSCQRKKDERKAFVEIFKYALKFSDMEFADNYEAWEILRGRRLTGSFGDFRSLEITKNEDEDVPEEFIELFYRFDGYKYTQEQKNRL